MTSRRHGERHAREMLAVGAALVSIAALLLAISGVPVLAVIVGGIGVVLVAAGAFLALTSQPPPSTQHIARLHDSARRVVERLEEGEASEFGEGHRPREAFVAHFPEAGAAIDEWDGLVSAELERTEALKAVAIDAVRPVAVKEWDSQTLDVERLETLLFEEALKCALDGQTERPISLLDLAPAIDQDDRPGESAADRKTRLDRVAHEVQALGEAAPKWPATVDVAESHERLQAFVQDEMPDLLGRLRRIQECSPAFASGCPVCKPGTNGHLTSKLRRPSSDRTRGGWIERRRDQ
jgi:hypothetical protein